MKSAISRILLSAALTLTFSVAAQAQCSHVTFYQLINYFNHLCSGSSSSESFFDGYTWDVSTDTACNLNGWKTFPGSSKFWDTKAGSMCGPTPANTPPICHGTLEGPYDLGFNDETAKHSFRMQETDNRYVTTPNPGCSPQSARFNDDNLASSGCQSAPCCAEDECRAAQGDLIPSTCECNFATPLIVDMNGSGYQLTSFADGVLFDLTGKGQPRQMSWTAASSDDAFLAIDRNNNGAIDDGSELFGNGAPVAGGTARNGFAALAAYDTNRDGLITAADDIYFRILLWTDSDHNARSDPSELRSLSEAGIEAISVQYKPSQHQDRFGNLLKYRAKLFGDKERFVYDVYFMLSAPATPASKSR